MSDDYAALSSRHWVKSGGAVHLEILATVEMAFLIEMIVHG